MPGTRLIDSQELKRLYRTMGGECVAHLSEALANKDLRPRDFSLRELCESIMGTEYLNTLRPKSGRRIHSSLMEADAVRFSDFSQITGQLLITETLDAYESEEFVFSQIIPSRQSSIQTMEKIPGISGIGDDVEIVPEAQEYPRLGMSQNYIEAAAKQKRGGIVDVTREAILGDLTGQLLDMARALGFELGRNKEKRLIDMVIDENAGATSAANGGHRYHWRGTSIATYGNNSGDHNWDNLAASNGLTDWTDVNNAWLLLRQMTDPFTGEPALFVPKHLVVTDDNLWTAKMIINATEVRRHVGGYATSGNLNEEVASSPVLDLNLQIVSSALVAARAATDTDWWLGDLTKAFCYLFNWDIETDEAPLQSHEAWTRDITMSFKVSEKGVPVTKEPRAMVESNA